MRLKNIILRSISFFYRGDCIWDVFRHPAFLLISVVASSLYYILLKGRDGIRSLGRMWVLFVGISVWNPLFNTQGATVLFRWIQGRPFTLEALGYGVATGGMFLSILLWFSCYNAVMTSDKFIYMFGRMIPTISLILSMVLRLGSRVSEEDQYDFRSETMYRKRCRRW